MLKPVMLVLDLQPQDWVGLELLNFSLLVSIPDYSGLMQNVFDHLNTKAFGFLS